MENNEYAQNRASQYYNLVDAPPGVQQQKEQSQQTNSYNKLDAVNKYVRNEYKTQQQVPVDQNGVPQATIQNKRKEYPEIGPNCRDFGGLGPIKYGLLYRGGRHSKNIKKLKDLGIDAEISITDKTVLDVPNKLQINWKGATDAQKGKLLTQCMKWIIEGHKVFIHCDRGCDRTGHFAAILEGILGASREDMISDFKLSDSKGKGYKITHPDETINGYCDRYGGKGTSGEKYQQNFIQNVIKKYGVDINLIKQFISVATNNNQQQPDQKDIMQQRLNHPPQQFIPQPQQEGIQSQQNQQTSVQSKRRGGILRKYSLGGLTSLGIYSPEELFSTYKTSTYLPTYSITPPNLEGPTLPISAPLSYTPSYSSSSDISKEDYTSVFGSAKTSSVDTLPSGRRIQYIKYPEETPDYVNSMARYNITSVPYNMTPIDMQQFTDTQQNINMGDQQTAGDGISDAMFQKLLGKEGAHKNSDGSLTAHAEGKSFGEGFVTGPYGMVYKHIDGNGNLLKSPQSFKEGEKVSDSWAKANARAYYNKKAKEIKNKFSDKNLTQNQLDAMVAATGGTVKSSNRFLEHMRQHWGDWDEISSWWKKFALTSQNGKVQPGLVKRRVFEANWFMGNKDLDNKRETNSNKQNKNKKQNA